MKKSELNSPQNGPSWDSDGRAEGNKLKNRLECIYGDAIKVTRGQTRRWDVSIDRNDTKIDIVVYLHTAKCAAAIWNQKQRRENGSSTHNFCWEHDYDKKIDAGYIDSQPHTFLRGEKRLDERVLFMSFDTLSQNIYDLYDLLQNPVEEDENATKRTRHTVCRWNRTARFRSEVLRAYGGQCAICRCAEEKLLQAAHIVAVADGGSDKAKNGICLCANHHLMLDNGLICIDCKNNKLSYVADSVKCMPWYSAFIENGGKILKRCEE